MIGPPAGILRVLGLGASAVVLTEGCLATPVTDRAQGTASLYTGFVALAVVVALVVYGLTTFAIVRYRQRSPDQPLPVQRQGDLRLEALWTLIPVVMVLGLFAATLAVLGRVDARSSGPVTEVDVNAYRWGWSFSYHGTGVTVSGTGDPGPEVVLPVGEPVRVTLTSADVIHAFFVPQFLFKRDAIPGRTTDFDFTIQDPGTYRGQCAEFCGLLHSKMLFTVKAVSRAEFEAWLAAAKQSAPPGSTPSSSGAGPAAAPAASASAVP